jgi:diketogulonate reductase-like aldo/keto reductase
VWNSDQGYDSTLKAFDASLERLGLDHVDLYLIHWQALKKDKYVETWKAFEQLYADKRVRSIGVSNFHIPALRRLFDESDLRPVVNQIELHPALPQDELRAFHAENDIVTQAWSPLASGSAGLLDNETLKRLGAKHGKSPAQVVIRWHLQLGNVVIPKSQTPSRIAENIDVFDFSLDNDDMAAIADLETGVRTGGDPDTFG